MYLSVYFSHLMNTVDRIYERLNDPLFSIRIELVDLFIFTHNETDLANTPNDYIYKVNNFYKNYFKKNAVNCDHTFFFHNNRDANILGVAFTNSICFSEKLTSIILFGFHANIELTMAHELAHNLGSSKHDDQDPKCDEQFLMNSFLVQNSNGYLFSHCSIDYIKRNLFINDELKPSFNCLIEENNLMKVKLTNYKNLLQIESPGSFYSLSDQCRIITQDPNSFKCDNHRNKSKICDGESFGCVSEIGMNKLCSGSYRALDGTPCDVNKVCRHTKCVDDELNIARNISKSRIQIYAQLLREHCPNGARQQRYYNFNLIVSNRFDCQDLIFEKDLDCDSQFIGINELLNKKDPVVI